MFEKGNKAWQLRSKHGRDALFSSAELLWGAACEYFEWCENNPLIEIKGFAFQGIVTKEEFPKMRAMTIDQLQFYLGVSDSYWRNFRLSATAQQSDFLTVINDIEQVIRTQKFQGAAADLLNPNIIARDLGLKEHTDHSGEIATPTTVTFKKFENG